MITEEENRKLTQVGPGTPMGQLLRRYWHPVAPAAELDEAPVKPIRILGEDLVLYCGGDGAFGLLSRACAHRGGDLASGIIEDCCIRCSAHGWLYDRNGQCLQQPLELEPFSEEVTLAAYAAEAKAGMIWAYLGPQPAPQIPDWEPFGWDDSLVQIVLAELPCNWLQCQEPAMDPIALAFEQAGSDAWQKTAALSQRITVEEFEYGFALSLTAGRPDEAQPSLDVERISLWPNGLVAGDSRSCRFEWRVPIDDENTLSVAWFADRAASGSSVPLTGQPYHWYAPIGDLQAGQPLLSHSLNRQFAIWLYQGRILDRTRENLTEADQGVALLRTRLLRQMELLADGGEPKAVIQPGKPNSRLLLPLAGGRSGNGREGGRDDAPVDFTIDPGAGDFTFIAGQPPEAAEAFKRVRGSWWANAGRPPVTPEEP